MTEQPMEQSAIEQMMQQPAVGSGSVECLGMTFSSDEERRTYFTARLREKIADPVFRATPGFPKSDSDEDILRLSDPPYYTACPNPFIVEFIMQDHRVPNANGYHRESLGVDVREGKTDAIYAAHSYHTKVPYRAIMPAILYYTQPGDLVLDGFAGSGMTGVAVQMCNDPDDELRRFVEKILVGGGYPRPAWGSRRVVLNDLGPAATFISANYNIPFDVDAFAFAARKLLADLKRDLGWMYETLHTDGKTRSHINYTVWSEVFACPNCGGEITFLDEAFDDETGRVRASFPCPHCGVVDLTKDNLQRDFETLADPATGEPWRRVRFKPILINYTIGSTKREKIPDEEDILKLKQIAIMGLPTSFPTNAFPIAEMYHGSRLAPKGFTHIHHLYLPRAAQALGTLWAKATAVTDARLRNELLFFIEQAVWGMSLFNRYQPIQQGRLGGSQVNRQLSGVYYVASQISEVSPWYNLENKLDRLIKIFRRQYAESGQALITTGTAAQLGLPDDSVDYIFTDPPFGENIYYADLNFLVESWHRVWTNTIPEAIIDRLKHKELTNYQDLMEACFYEYYRVLKPGRWITVVFHNSRIPVWTAIQDAMLAAGFLVVDVKTLDKVQQSYRQVTSDTAKEDMIISAYKPAQAVQQRFALETGDPEDAWVFMREYLSQLPMPRVRQGKLDALAARMGTYLYDRMLAYYVRSARTIPYSRAEFLSELPRRFPERDDMFFLPEQVIEYDRRRMSAKEVTQLPLFVINEDSAIKWLRQQLQRKPQTFQELHPQFLRELGSWQRQEKPLELSELLEENFLQYKGGDRIPAQIVSWMQQSSELRPLIATTLASGAAREDNGAVVTQSSALVARAMNRWYVPNPNEARDHEAVREKALLKDFEEYIRHRGRQFKQIRLEAVRAGFKRAWQNKDYRTIVEVGRKIAEDTLYQDSRIALWYDQSRSKLGED